MALFIKINDCHKTIIVILWLHKDSSTLSYLTFLRYKTFYRLFDLFFIYLWHLSGYFFYHFITYLSLFLHLPRGRNLHPPMITTFKPFLTSSTCHTIQIHLFYLYILTGCIYVHKTSWFFNEVVFFYSFAHSTGYFNYIILHMLLVKKNQS